MTQNVTKESFETSKEKIPLVGDSKEKIPLIGDEKLQIIYFNLIAFSYWHLAGLYGLYQCFTTAKCGTIILAFIICVLGMLGVTAGAHRLWAHRAYKAKMPLQIILMVFNSFAFQNTAITWVRDHRLHHKCTDTDADPHNSRRGIFYSHVGWLLVRKNERVKQMGRTINMTDLYSNPVLVFQKKYAIPFISLVTFIIPTVLPVYLFGESLITSWNITMLRYITSLNCTFMVNSLAHAWGYKPYDAGQRTVQNLAVSLAALGEGFHNYHHTFPWDYRNAELGNNWLNLSTLFIDFFAWIGWAYDLKTAPHQMIETRKKKTGDGTDLWGRRVGHTQCEKETNGGLEGFGVY